MSESVDTRVRRQQIAAQLADLRDRTAATDERVDRLLDDIARLRQPWWRRLRRDRTSRAKQGPDA